MTTEHTYSPPAWSMMSPATTGVGAGTGMGVGATNPPPMRGGGRPEEIEEQRRFAAAFARAQEQTQGETQAPAPSVTAYRASSPEERMSNAGLAPTTVDGEDFFGEDGMTLGDFVDIINPLQHIPVVSTIYREMTGDEISPGARLAGGALYGGPVGFASALANNVATDLNGQDIAGSVMAALAGEDIPIEGDGASVTALNNGVDPAVDVDQLAAMAPAAGPVAGPAADVTASAEEGLVPPTNASPIMAAQPPAGGSGAPFAAIPNGSPMAVIQPPGIPLIQQDAPVQPIPLAQNQPPETSAVTAAGQGVPNLSPDAANVLLRMAQTSQTPAVSEVVAAPPPSVAPPATTIAPPPATTIAPPPPAADTAAVPEGADRSQVAGYIDPVSAEDLPSAMMDALQKYESMKQ